MGKDMDVVSRLRRSGVVAIDTARGRDFFKRLYRDLGEAGGVVVTGSMGSSAAWRALMGSSAGGTRGGFLEEVVSYQPGIEAVVTAELTVGADRYLLDHDFEGSLLFPTVFGLEAMAQVAALIVTPEEGERVVEIRDVELAHPIVADRDEATKLVIHGVAREDGAGRSVDVAIYLEKTGMREPHFSSTMIFGPDCATRTAAAAVPVPIRELDIVPRRDLYGDLLFQGKLFQRMGAVLGLSDDRLLVRVAGSAVEEGPTELRANARSGQRLLRDPFLRDLTRSRLPASRPHRAHHAPLAQHRGRRAVRRRGDHQARRG
jgi:hypothetical protein